MSTFGMVFNLVLGGGFVAIVGYIAASYLTAPRTMTVNSLKPEDPPITRPSTVMDKLAYSTKRSATLFMQLATGAFLLGTKAIMDMADFIGAPEVREWVTQHTSPEVGGIAVLIILGLTTWARVRNMAR